MSFHEHNSLLDHKVEEELSESERRAAWAEYKAEVIRPVILYGARSERSDAANVNATLSLLFSVSHRGQPARLEPERGHPGHQNGRAARCRSPFSQMSPRASVGITSYI